MDFYTVQRKADLDFFFFDALFSAIFQIIVLYFGKKKEFKIGLFMGGVALLVDYFIWYLFLGTRNIQLPLTGWARFWWFFEFDVFLTSVIGSWVALMFTHSIFSWWTVLYIVEQFAVIGLSVYVDYDQRPVFAVRHMDWQRAIQLAFVLVTYYIIYKWKKDWKLVARLFLIGMLASLIMGFPLYLFGSRTCPVWVEIWNTFFEWNSGVPILYMMWENWINKKEKKKGN